MECSKTAGPSALHTSHPHSHLALLLRAHSTAAALPPPRCRHLMIAVPASMWVEIPGELVKLIAQQKSLRCGTMRQVCKAWHTALVPSFAELEPYLQKVPRETLVPPAGRGVAGLARKSARCAHIGLRARLD